MKRIPGCTTNESCLVVEIGVFFMEVCVSY
jgi:hypothetical protein